MLEKKKMSFNVVFAENNDSLLAFTKNAASNFVSDVEIAFASSVAETNNVINSNKIDLILASESFSDGSWNEINRFSDRDDTIIPVILLVDDVKKYKECPEGILQVISASEKTYSLLDQFFPIFLRERKCLEDKYAAEQALYEHEAQFSAVTKFAVEAIISVDAKGDVIFWNRGAESMFGYRAEEIIGKSAEVLIPERFRDLIKNRVQELKDGSADLASDRFLEAEAKHKEGNEFHVEFSISSWVNKKKRYFMAIIRDVSKRKRTEEELLRVQKLESVGTIAGGIAHDFNNILTGIVTDLFAAKMNLETNSEEYKLISEAEASAFRATSLARQFMSFASNSQTPLVEPMNLEPIIEEAVGFTLSGSNVSYELDIHEELYTVEVDRGQINQVLSNLVLNAAQSMPEGGKVKVLAENVMVNHQNRSKIESYLDLEDGRFVKISVVDTGHGIPEDHMLKIFDPYFTTKKTGSGFGLATAFSIINKHGGVITAKSTINEGSTFIIYLPALEIPSIAEVEEENHDHKELAGNGEILVMDDDLAVQKALGIVLKHLGYKVELTSTGEEAIEVYRKAVNKGEHFAAVIMDLTIPGHMGGKEAVGKILEIDPHAKVIVSTGYSTDPVVAEFQKYGFSAAMNKPFSVDVVKNVLKKVIA